MIRYPWPSFNSGQANWAGFLPKKEDRPTVRRKLATCLLSIAMLSLISGCAMSPAQQRGVVIGAASGAVLGAGLGCGIARASYGSGGQDDGLADEIGCPVGF